MKIVILILMLIAAWFIYQKDYAGFALISFIAILSYLEIIHEEIKNKKSVTK